MLRRGRSLWCAIVLRKHPDDDADHADTDDTEGEPVLRIHEEHHVKGNNTGTRDGHPLAVGSEADKHRNELGANEHEWRNLTIIARSFGCGVEHDERHEDEAENLTDAIFLIFFADKAGTN